MKALSVLILTLLLIAPARAHHLPVGDRPPPNGLSIPSLTHGQMIVIDRHLPAIRALSRQRIGSNMILWRLEDYLNLQSFACFWGLAPGAITDETSPFNECAHAYLAAARALLLRMREAPGVDHTAVENLTRKIEADMLAEGAALTLCRYSDEPFNTNDIVWPRWSAIPFHPPSALVAAGLLLILGLALRGLAPARPVVTPRDHSMS